MLLGPSGCGKTTLLRCVAGLEDAQDGTITLGDNVVLDVRRRLNLPTHKRDIGLVFQNYSLWPHMTVRRNVEYPLRARGSDRATRDRRVNEVLDMVQCRASCRPPPVNAERRPAATHCARPRIGAAAGDHAAR